MREPIYEFSPPTTAEVPILISVPHCGIFFPKQEIDTFEKRIVSRPEDTDWFVDQLYSFAPQMGIGLIAAKYSRYVVDLNRDPNGSNLYSDNRIETKVIPERTFSGEVVFRKKLTQIQIDERIKSFFIPYHEKIKFELERLKRRFKHVLLVDAHSIKRKVPSISEFPFADIILGNQDGKTSEQLLLNSIVSTLEAANQFVFAINKPFKGGFITRHFGRPDLGIHAIQIEMSQDIYMDEKSHTIHQGAFAALQGQLHSVFKNLVTILEKLN